MSKTHISDFEELFNKGVLERAEELADVDHIHDFQMKNNAKVFEATVDDGTKHKVRIEQQGGFLTDLTCDCDFDFGHCKHLAALLIFLQREFVGEEQMDNEELEELIPLLEDAEKEDLIQLIVYLADMHPDIHRFITDYIQSGGFEMEDDSVDLNFDEFEQEMSQIGDMLNQLILAMKQLYEEEEYAELTVLMGDVLTGVEFGQMREADISGNLQSFPDQLFEILHQTLEEPGFDEEDHEFLWGHLMELLEEERIHDEIISDRIRQFLASQTADNTQLARFKSYLDKISGSETLFSGSIDDEQYDRLLSIAREGKSKEDE